MDGDVFAKAGKSVRSAVHALHDVLAGRSDPHRATSRWIEVLLFKAKGLRLFADIIEQVEHARGMPLFFAQECQAIAQKARMTACEADRTALDLITAREAAYLARKGDICAEVLAHRILQSLADRLILESRDGYVQTYGHERLDEVRAALAPMLREAAAELGRRPGAQRLRLTSAPEIHAETNLLARADDE